MKIPKKAIPSLSSLENIRGGELLSFQQTNDNKVINCATGIPHFQIPLSLKKILAKQFFHNPIEYTSCFGLLELRKLIIEKYKITSNFKDIDCVITSGASCSVYLSLAACVNKGENVLLFEPYFSQYLEAAKILGLNIIFLDTFPNFHPKLDYIINYCLKYKVKAVVINSPNNPTGVVFNFFELKNLIHKLEFIGIFCIIDIIYENFIYTNEQIQYEMLENVVLCSGISKTYNLTGVRIGYAMSSNLKLIQTIAFLQSNIYVSPSSISQYMAIQVLKTQNYLQQPYYINFCYIKENLDKCYFLSNVQGGFFAFIKVPECLNLNASDFCEKLRNKLLLLPGKFFSRRDDYFRMSICISHFNIQKAVKILNKVLHESY